MKNDMHSPSIGLIGAISLALSLLTFVPAFSEAPRKVGDYEPLDVATTHPYPHDGTDVWRRTIRFPGATYIRLHFRQFELAEGDWLEVAGPDGEDPARYTGRGPLGTGEFWAFTVRSEAATLVLHADSGGGFGFEIDGAGRGTESLAGPATPPLPSGTICGSTDWKDAKCYQASRPTEYANSRATALAIIDCCDVCTAFKVSDSGQFMFSSACRVGTSIRGIELKLEDQATACDSGVVATTGSVMGNNDLAFDQDLDYLLFDTIGDSSGIPCLQLDRRMPDVGEPIYIAHQPTGGGTKLSIESDQDAGGVCAVQVAPIDGYRRGTDIAHRCDTQNGSLGAPIISAATQRVVAIQHFGDCPGYNQGTRVDLIYPRIAALLGSCSNGVTCKPVNGGRCDCNGVCSTREAKYVSNGGTCPDCP